MARVLVLIVVLAAALVGTVGANGYTLPDQVTGPVGGDPFSTGFELRPFGWSAAGAFAYMESRFVDGRGGTIFRYVVLDSVEDKVVFDYKDDSFDWPDGGQDATSEQGWAKDAETVSAALQARKVVQSPSTMIRRFPLTRSGDRYTADLKVETDPQKDETEDGRVSAFTLRLASQKRGFEGTDEYLRFYGAHLTAGFRK